MRPKTCGNPKCGNPLPKTRWVFCSDRCSNRVHHAKERERKALARTADPVNQVAPVLRESSVIVPGRVCHDCKRPTSDYRCPTCLARWRARHGVPVRGGGAGDLDCEDSWA